MDIVQVTVAKQGKPSYIQATYTPSQGGATCQAEVILALPASDTNTNCVSEIYCTPMQVFGGPITPSWGVYSKGYRYSSLFVAAKSQNEARAKVQALIKDTQLKLKSVVECNLKRIAETPPSSKHALPVAGGRGTVEFKIEYSYITALGVYGVQITLTIPADESGEIPSFLRTTPQTVFNQVMDEIWGTLDRSNNTRFLTHTWQARDSREAVAIARAIVQRTLKEIEASAR